MDISRHLFRGITSDTAVADIQLCKKFWPTLAQDDLKEYPPHQYTTLTSHLKERVSAITQTLSPYVSSAAATQTLDSTIACVHNSQHRPVKDVAEEFKSLIPSWEENERKFMDITYSTISLAAMVDIDRKLSNPTSLDRSLAHLIDQHFSPARDIKPCPISPELTVSYLVVNYGFSVRWTDYLNEHLDINWDRRILWIFQHKVWLAAQINSKTDTLLPLEVAEEALDTLNCLFPHHHTPTTSFMAKHGQEFHRLGSFNRKPRTEVSDFKYWGGKIEQLMGELSKPRRGLRQLRPDKRNVLNPVNFWVAAGLACLAFLSSIVFGAVSIYYAKRSLEVSEQSLELSRLQYLLSVAQACSTPEDAQSLPEFCSN